MNRSELEHILRACKGTTGEMEFMQARLAEHAAFAVGVRRGQTLTHEPVPAPYTKGRRRGGDVEHPRSSD